MARGVEPAMARGVEPAMARGVQPAMARGADPNVGRLLMAVGKCFDVSVSPTRTGAWINGFEVVRHGTRLDFADSAVRATLSAEVVDLVVDLGMGGAEATAFGCDLSAGYVAENAAYYSS